MIFRVTLLQGFSDRPRLAVQVRHRLRDGSVQAWPVVVRPESSDTVLSVDSSRDMALPGTLSMVAHYASPPAREERQIARVEASGDSPRGPPSGPGGVNGGAGADRSGSADAREGGPGAADLPPIGQMVADEPDPPPRPVPVELILHVRPAPSGDAGNRSDRAGPVGHTTIRQTLRAGVLPGAVLAAVAVGIAMSAAAKPAVSMRGSPASMERQHAVAVSEDFTFATSPASVNELVKAEALVPLSGSADYMLHRVSFPYARPEVRTFVENLATEYRKGCGEQLVVTSLTRPTSNQPGNAHKLSVHPAGMAVDFRISKSSKCQQWFEKALLAMEGKNLLDATRERNPPHFHVAVFPGPYAAYAARQKPAERTVPASPTVLRPEVWPQPPARQPSAAPAPAAARRPPSAPLETPQTAGALVAAGIIGALALFVIWLMRRTKRMI
jgi:hypothetical protein